MTATIRKTVLWLLKIAAAPFVGFGRGAVAGGPLTWALHVLLVAGVLVGLWQLNSMLELEKIVHAPSRLLRELWLPLMFALAYAIAWASLWTWRAASCPNTASPYPELDRCWRQALAAMRRHGVNLDDKPLVMLLGEPAGREAELLSAFALTPGFGPVPSQADAKVRVFSDDQAIYLMCHEASLLSQATDRLAQHRMARNSRSEALAQQQTAEEKLPASLRAQAPALVGGIGSEASPTESSDPPDRMPEHQGSCAGVLDNSLDFLPAATAQPLYTTEQADRCAGELEHLMRLVRQQRESIVPIDAVAILTPFDAAGSDVAAEAVAGALQQDMSVLSDAAAIRCPVLSVVTELQHAPGCGRLLHTLSGDRKSRRLGTQLPSDTDAGAQETESAVEELTQRLAPALCQRLMQVEPETGSDAETLTDNAALFEFQASVAERGERLAGLLSRGLAGDSAGPWPLRGCYLVATGDALGGSQAFGAGVLESLTQPPSHAAWTQEALSRDAYQNRTVKLGYAGLAAAVLLVGCLLFV